MSALPIMLACGPYAEVGVPPSFAVIPGRPTSPTRFLRTHFAWTNGDIKVHKMA